MTSTQNLSEVLRIFGKMANQLYPDLEYFDDSSQPDTIIDVARVCGKLVEEIETARRWEEQRLRIAAMTVEPDIVDETALTNCDRCSRPCDEFGCSYCVRIVAEIPIVRSVPNMPVLTP